MFLKYIWRAITAEAGTLISLAIAQNRFPTCKFYRGARIDRQSTFGKYTVIFSNVSIVDSKIGNHSFVQKYSNVHHAQIGNFCSIAPGVTIGLGQHPTDMVSTHPAFYSKTQPIAKTFSKENVYESLKKTVIEHDVWIGQNALITDGLTIGTGAVIAAGAVVTKNIPEYAIVAGVPARILRYRFDEKLKQKIIETKWWEKPEEWLRKHAGLFSNPRKFVHSNDSDKRTILNEN